MSRPLFLVLVLVQLCLAVSLRAVPSALPLGGDWRLRLDPADLGTRENWGERGVPAATDGGGGRIVLPGSTDQVGAGVANTAAPTLDGLYRPWSFAGPAWFEREFTVPAAWSHKRVVLFFERAHGEVQVWLDGKPLGKRETLSTPVVYDLGLGLSGGKHRIVVRTDNAPRFELGRFASIRYDGAQTNWSGLVGRVELRSNDEVSIDEVQLHPALKAGRLRLICLIANFKEKPVKISVEVTVLEKASGRVVANDKTSYKIEERIFGAALEVALPDEVKRWDEFSPVLHEVRVRVSSRGTLDEWRGTVGFRDVGTTGRKITVNGNPVFLRGTVDRAVFPLTGYPPMELAYWRERLAAIKAYGFNHVRFHSWCPPDAAFTAADELGLYLQVEAPQANTVVGAVPLRDTFIAAETKRILSFYGNHPSFVLFSPGNELRGDKDVLTALVDTCVRADPRHLYTSSTYGFGALTENRQFSIGNRARGVKGEGTDGDHAAVLKDETMPSISHELGQWAVYPDVNDAAAYTGVLQARNLELVRADLDKKGLLPLAPRFVEATGRQALGLYKEEIEAVLRTPGAAGFQLLGLQDYPGQGMGMVGMVNALGVTKPFVTAEEFRRFNGATVPLARLKKRAWTTAETLVADVEIAHHGAATLPAARISWRVADDAGAEIGAGEWDGRVLESGFSTVLGRIDVPLGAVKAPARLTLRVRVEGKEPAENSWNVWVYPPAGDTPTPAGVVEAREWNAETRAALAAGRTVLLQVEGAISGRRRGSYRPVFWSPVWFKADPATMGLLCDPTHPALAGFPTSFYSDWQWWDLQQRSGSIILNEAPADLTPIIRVVDNFARNDRLGALVEGRVGPGKLLLTGFDLMDRLEERPAAAQLRRSVLAYLASPAFSPKTELAPAMLDRLFEPAEEGIMSQLGARVMHVDAQAGSRPGFRAIDNNPDTAWQTPWTDEAPRYPHEIVVEIPKRIMARGVRILPTQDANGEGRVRDYALYISREGAEWGKAVVQGVLPKGADWVTLVFDEPREVKLIRFVALSGYEPGNPSAAIAEIELVPAL